MAQYTTQTFRSLRNRGMKGKRQRRVANNECFWMAGGPRHTTSIMVGVSGQAKNTTIPAYQDEVEKSNIYDLLEKEMVPAAAFTTG